MTTMTGAELRSLIVTLGLNPLSLARLIGYDPRGIRRMTSGITPVTPKIIADVDRLIEQSDAHLRTMQAATERGIPIIIPHVDGEHDGYPGTWWHAVAGRLLRSHPHASVTYTERDTPDMQ